MEPEAKARLNIDRQLEEAGWVLQDMAEFSPYASKGVAVREFKTNDGHEVDYALFVNGQPCGLVEAKPAQSGVTLETQAHEQNMGYVRSGLKGAGYDKDDLRFIYEATGEITHFVDLRDPKPRTRKIFSFHQPRQLERWITEYAQSGTTLRARLRQHHDLPPAGFRDCQVTAILNLERSFANNKQRSLIQMATGAGKTYTAITFCYRLLKFAKARRILFLVDTKNLGRQAETEYKNYTPYDTTSKFSTLYDVQRLQSSYITDDTQICISTIQRMYSMLRGELQDFDDDLEEGTANTTGAVREVVYNRDYPPEYFDFIIIDECHRSIYNQWRQVLEYFDAFLIGLTATPSTHTFAFFDQNVVSEYSHEQAVDDGVNVGALGTFLIETQKTRQGGLIAQVGQQVSIRDRKTRKQRWETADEVVEYEGSDLDDKVVSPSQIRTILTAFRDNWRKWIYFRDREELPKTLIFAKNDSHADDIVRTVKEVFDEGNDFCKKITYRSEENEDKLLYDFRNAYYPRVAVTVTKIATGTDVKPIEILVFMRDVRSENYYEQMLGRARRTLGEEELKLVSPSASTPKLGYVVVDAIGVTKSEKRAARGKCGTDIKYNVPFKTLLMSVATGDTSDETLLTLGTRLEHLEKVLTDKQRAQFTQLTGGTTLKSLAASLKWAHDVDRVQEDTLAAHPDYASMPPEQQHRVTAQVIEQRCRAAARPITDAAVRNFLLTVRKSDDQTIDPSLDRIVNQGFDEDVQRSNDEVRTLLRQFIDEHRDEIDALTIIYSQDYRHRHLTMAMISDLYERMVQFNHNLNKGRIFAAYEDRKRLKTPLSQLIDIIQVIRYEWGLAAELTPFRTVVQRNFKRWIFERNANKGGERGAGTQPFTAEQLEWLTMIRDHIALNGSLQFEDFNYGTFADKGGGGRYYELFGDQWERIINELNERLIA